jgi:hypothetical protein
MNALSTITKQRDELLDKQIISILIKLIHDAKNELNIWTIDVTNPLYNEWVTDSSGCVFMVSEHRNESAHFIPKGFNTKVSEEMRFILDMLKNKNLVTDSVKKLLLETKFSKKSILILLIP